MQISLEISEQDKSAHNFKLTGAIIVADDQHINLEIMKQQTLSLGVQDQTLYCVNGQ